MSFRDSLGKIKGKIMFWKKGEEDFDLGGEDLGLGETSPEEPSLEGIKEDALLTEEESKPEEEKSELEKDLLEEEKEEPVPVLGEPELENIRIELDTVNSRLENISHKFELLSTELDTLHSEEDYQKTLAQKYIFLLNTVNRKLDVLEKQHEELWRLSQRSGK